MLERNVLAYCGTLRKKRDSKTATTGLNAESRTGMESIHARPGYGWWRHQVISNTMNTLPDGKRLAVHHGQDLCDHELAVSRTSNIMQSSSRSITPAIINPKLVDNNGVVVGEEAARIKAIFNNVLVRLVV